LGESLILRWYGAGTMVDVESALLNVQERDNWRRRMEALERSLAEVRDLRRKVEARLRRTRRDLVRLRDTAEALVTPARLHSGLEIARATPGPVLRSR
jgi:septal ring factor EnvC (AmiA/AmiB activator)